MRDKGALVVSLIALAVAIVALVLVLGFDMKASVTVDEPIDPGTEQPDDDDDDDGPCKKDHRDDDDDDDDDDDHGRRIREA